jgi:hypothetical protein
VNALPDTRTKSQSRSAPSPRVRWPHVVLTLIGLAGLYLAGRFAAVSVIDHFGFHLYPRLEPMMHQMILLATVCYVILIAIPFMPGVEIGLSLIAFLGPKIAFLVYVSTILGLTISYTAGRFIPVRYCAGALGFVGFIRAQNLVNKIAPMTSAERLDYLTENAPPGILPFLLRHRFLALAAAINLPGNALIGGGGGIALFAGMSGLFPFPMYLLTIALAVAPVPLIISITGL